jgi:hypothetical protein
VGRACSSAFKLYLPRQPVGLSRLQDVLSPAAERYVEVMIIGVYERVAAKERRQNRNALLTDLKSLALSVVVGGGQDAAAN